MHRGKGGEVGLMLMMMVEVMEMDMEVVVMVIMDMCRVVGGGSSVAIKQGSKHVHSP